MVTKVYPVTMYQLMREADLRQLGFPTGPWSPHKQARMAKDWEASTANTQLKQGGLEPRVDTRLAH